MTARETRADETASTDTVLEVRDARVTFDMARGRARVLDDVSVEIRRGETFAVCGESGSGKSMFGSILLDAVPEPGQASGEVLYYPEDADEPVNVLDLSPRRLRRLRWEEIAIVSQAATDSFNPSITVRRHFRDTFEAHDVDPAAGFERAREVLGRLNLDPERILDAHQHELSGGEKQRAMLALALVFDPEVLVLDEPTAGLDLLVQREILGLLYEIKEEYDLTLVFVSHDIPIVAGFADRLGIVYAFEFVEIGDARDVLLEPEHPYTRLFARATLEPGADVDAAAPIEGEPPDAVNVPTGCAFHPRCPLADGRCEVEDPELRGDGKRVACFYPDRAVDRIDHSIERRGGDDR